MIDRELLELAAKAAGIKYDAKASQPHPVSGAFFGLWLMIHGEPYEGQRRWWNPLTNDGDALRLAVKLRIMVEQCLFETKVSAYVRSGSERQHFTSVSGNVTREQATRDAIVRAAARIGKDMP